MYLQLEEIGKKFNREWIFKGFSHLFKKGTRTAITGANGSGKSTLLKIISTAELPSTGKVILTDLSENQLPTEKIFSEINFVAPYLDCPEYFNLKELYDFHQKFKPFELDFDQFAERLYLTKSLDKEVKKYSSGMKQRLKLGLALISQSSVVILDEPCSNLDEQGIQLYESLLADFTENKIIIIGSNNNKNEMHQITDSIDLMLYKK